MRLDARFPVCISTKKAIQSARKHQSLHREKTQVFTEQTDAELKAAGTKAELFSSQWKMNNLRGRAAVFQKAAQILRARSEEFTNNAETVEAQLATDISKTATVNFRPPSSTEQMRQAVAAFRGNDPIAATELLQLQNRVYEYASPEH